MGTNVVITGIGVLSSVAVGRDAYWEALFAGKTGFRPVTLFDAAAFGGSVCGEVPDFDPLAFLGKKGLRDLDRSTRLICSASKLALDDGKLEITADNTHAAGVAIGTTFGSLHSISQFDRSGLIEGPRAVNPSHFPNTVINSPASQVSIRFKIKGFNTTVSTGFCAGLDAVSYAADCIRLGRTDVVLAGGVEELCEETFMGFQKLGFLSGSDGTEPRCCPFDARRNGAVLSEGAAVLILEKKEHALGRGAAVVAAVLGYGSSFDPSAERIFSHAGQGLARAVARALDDAGLEPDGIDCVFSSADSTPGLDRMETAVIRDLFGDRAAEVPVSAVKSMIGETYSAAGALSLAAAAGALARGTIPPTVNFRDRDPACDLDYVPNAARQVPIRTALVTAADPYGQNTAVVLGRHE